MKTSICFIGILKLLINTITTLVFDHLFTEIGHLLLRTFLNFSARSRAQILSKSIEVEQPGQPEPNSD
ncbi:uncharacterized protein OCT59_026832 [Rhizophagus irregularis]|uniref:uncharacterized protein n=1 Tax=Rhizophagus irregularis TaxID=588596 RepID=UPI001C16D688|nr:hypothetical protein OCT59_026832 [Rhizophagus irregularis]CAB5386893.1 unnamed protein product [Rhizophagus irregularis]